MQSVVFCSSSPSYDSQNFPYISEPHDEFLDSFLFIAHTLRLIIEAQRYLIFYQSLLPISYSYIFIKSRLFSFYMQLKFNVVWYQTFLYVFLEDYFFLLSNLYLTSRTFIRFLLCLNQCTKCFYSSCQNPTECYRML